MSQTPPNPYGTPPPPPYGQPPGQYPPLGYPSQGAYPPTSTSGSAITSLVCGLVLCVPYITGLLAVIFGIVGIRATKSPAVKGRGMAIAGLILGIIGMIGWTVYFAVVGAAWYAMLHGSLNPFLAQGFFQQMSVGNTAGALQMCKPGTPQADVQATVDQMKGYGPMVAFNRANAATVNNRTTIDGTIQFQTGGTHPFDVVVDKGPNGVPQVQSWDLK